MKEKQTLIDQVERLKQSEREYELKVQELMERNTQLKVLYPTVTPPIPLLIYLAECINTVCTKHH